MQYLIVSNKNNSLVYDYLSLFHEFRRISESYQARLLYLSSRTRIVLLGMHSFTKFVLLLILKRPSSSWSFELVYYLGHTVRKPFLHIRDLAN